MGEQHVDDCSPRHVFCQPSCPQLQWNWAQQIYILTDAAQDVESFTLYVAGLIFAAAAQAKRPVLTLEEEEQLESKDQSMGQLLDKLGAAIHGRHINIMPKKEDLPATPSQTSSTGRLPPHALAELLNLQKQAAGGPVDAGHLILKYQVDPALISRVLRVVCAPELLQAQGSAGVQAFAGYPDWFQRRG
eukprot:gene5362-5595_t